MSTNAGQYPCDRGTPGNVSSRGWHNFQAGPTGAVVCTLCGERRGSQPWTPSPFPPMPQYRGPFSTSLPW